MQPLVIQVATTFVNDARSRIVTHLVMAPVERIAKACDVAGILAERAARATKREQVRHAWHAISQRAPKPHRSRRHGGLFNCLRSLGELT